MWNALLKTLGRIVWIGGGLLLLLFFLQILHLFLLLHASNPIGSWVLAGGLLGLVLVGFGYVGRLLFSYPQTLKAPPLPPVDQATHLEMIRYLRYLKKFLQRLADNPNLDASQRATAGQAIIGIDSTLGAHPLNDDLKRSIQQTEAKTLTPLLKNLEDKASREIRTCVRDVMLAVTFSPYQSIDMLVVLYRNTRMILRIVEIYSSRPRPREQFLILQDTLKVIITVNFMNAGRNLLESLFSHMPFIGRIMDDLAQGLGAGLLTSASGYAATQRCAAYRRWDEEEAAQSLAHQARTFLGDVRDIFTKDVFPNLKTRIRLTVPEEVTDQPGYWDAVKNGVNDAVDNTAGMIDSLVIRPAVATTQTMVRAGTTVAKGGSHGVKAVVDYLNIFRK